MARTELTISAEEFAMRQIKTDITDGIGKQVYDYLLKIAKEWAVTVTNIAWLQNKPYPMQGALYQMLKTKCDKEGLIVKSMCVKAAKRAEQNDKRAGFEAEIVLFNQSGFNEVMKGATLDKITVELLREAREIMTHTYREEGWASIETVKAPAMQNPDYLNHMGATRALDRTLRMIVRCPFTAASELPDGTPGELLKGLPGLDAPPGISETPTAKPGEPAPGPETAKPGKPKGEKVISDKPIKKIEGDGTAKPSKPAKPGPKEGKVNEKQVNLATLQWETYCKTAAPSLDKAEIESKRTRLLKALFGVEAVADLTIAQLEELVGLMQRKEIDIVPDGATPPEKVEIKT